MAGESNGTNSPMPGSNSVPNANQNPWSALKELASQRRLKFRPEIAFDIANTAALTIGRVRAMQSDSRLLATGMWLTPLKSGLLLSNIFQDRSTALFDVMGMHLKILQDMVDTMIAAGKAYDRTDTGNADTFKEYKSKLDGVKIPPGAERLRRLEWPATLPALNGRTPDDISDALKAFGDSKGMPMVREPDGPAWRTMYDLRKHIENNRIVEQLARWSHQYNFMADDVHLSFTDLKTKAFTQATDWEGDGKEAAIAAINSYVLKTDDLEKAMRLVGELADRTRQYIEWTRDGMPTEPDNPWRPGDTDSYLVSAGPDYEVEQRTPAKDPLYGFQENFKNRYTSKLPLTAERIPMFPSPEASFSGIPALPPVNQTTTPGATNPGGMPAGSRGGSMPSSSGMSGARPFGSSADPTRAVVPQLKSDEPQHDSAGPHQPQNPSALEPSQNEAGGDGSAAGSQALQQALSAAQQAAAPGSVQPASASPRAGLPGTPAGLDPKTGMPKLGSGSGSPLGAGPLSSPAKELAQFQTNSPFPRAGLPSGLDGASAARAGSAPTSATPGSPGAPGAAARGAEGANGAKDHKQSAALKSTTHLDEAMGELVISRPVLDE